MVFFVLLNIVVLEDCYTKELWCHRHKARCIEGPNEDFAEKKSHTVRDLLQSYK